MAITSEERRAINRRNSQRSTGPKTPEGKARAKLNALKHGLRAEAFALPGEDQEHLRQLTDEWLEYYEPSTPGQRGLLDRCVLATVQLHRCARLHAQTVAEQVRRTRENLGYQQEDELERLKKLLKTEPYEAVRHLRRSTLGCRWMLDQWDELIATLDAGLIWVNSERDRAIRLLGSRPEPKTLVENPLAYQVYYYHLFSHENPSAEAIDWLTDPARMPDTMARTQEQDGEPDWESSRATLREVARRRVAELIALEARLCVEVEGPSLASLVDRASLLGGPEGAILARYERMHDTMYHRSYKALLTGEVPHEDEVTPITPPPPMPLDPFAETVSVVDLTAARNGAPNEATGSIPTITLAVLEAAMQTNHEEMNRLLKVANQLEKQASPSSDAIESADPPDPRGS